ncbi:hypothetical protein [Azospirillum sp. TSO22-1]|uniref:hypothetical protein n=1 Tax=Azospirillum sp. TSO22-1 TaxID=716789 RepID=UPI001304DEBB|nr:hypothetical protein [Azospirillum sp. TSO22-1]
MDTETAVTVIASLDRAEHVLSEIRVHQHDEHGWNSIARQRALLDEARCLLDRAHECL